MPAIFLTAEWRHLLMLNYEVDPIVLAGHVPAGVEVDLWRGRALVSIVGFRFLRTKVLGIPIPFHRNFDEVNLRFYVRRRVGSEWRKGVVFVKEIVPRWAIAFVARTVYNENYVRWPMRSHVNAAGAVNYEWRAQGAWEGISAIVASTAKRPDPDSEETFITEHYWGYARQPDGTTVEYRVDHPPWRVSACVSPVLTCDVGPMYGAKWVEYLSVAPASVFLADGSAVAVHKGERIRPTTTDD